MCSSNSAGKITKAYYSTCVAVADFVLVTLVMPVECSAVDWGQAASSGFFRLCPHYIGCGFCLAATPKGDGHNLSTQGEEKEYLSSCKKWCRNITPLLSYSVLRYFLPPSLFSASQFRGWITRQRPDIAFSPRVNSAKSRRSGVGVDWVALWPAFPQTQKLVFYDFSKFTWHLPHFLAGIFSSWNSGFFYVTLAFR